MLQVVGRIIKPALVLTKGMHLVEENDYATLRYENNTGRFLRYIQYAIHVGYRYTVQIITTILLGKNKTLLNKLYKWTCHSCSNVCLCGRQTSLKDKLETVKVLCQAAEKLQRVRVNLPYLTLHVVQCNYCTWANCNVELKQSVWGKLLLISNALHITRYLYLKVISYFKILEYVQRNVLHYFCVIFT